MANPGYTVLIDEFVGDAYPYVKLAALNINYIKHVSSNLERISTVADISSNIKEIIENMGVILTVEENSQIALNAAEDATNALTTILSQQFPNLASVLVYSPTIAPTMFIIAGYYSGGDGGGATYKKVNSEPTHEGKFAITLSGGAIQWYELAENEVHIAMLGAKMDGVADDSTALLNAHNIGKPVRLGPGRIRLASKISITNYMPIWRGAGSDVTYGTELKHTNTTTLIGDHTDTCVIDLRIPTAAGQNMIMEGIEISGKPSNPPNNQHGIVVACRTAWSSYINMTFSDLTGYGIAYDPSVNSYSQNIAIRDSSFFKTGGDVGYTAEPANNSSYLACSLLRVDNVDHDHSINTKSPQFAIWDLRAIREVSFDTLVIEGNGGSLGSNSLFAFASDSVYSFNNMHFEFNNNRPTYIAYFYADPNSRYYGSNESIVRFTNFLGQGKFGFDTGVESQLLIQDWSFYSAADWTDIAYFASQTAGHMVVERLHVKQPFSIPIWLAGRLDVNSFHMQDQLGPVIQKVPTRLASWRAADGDPVAFNAHILSMVNGIALGSSAIEEDNNDTRLQVWRATSTVGSRPAPQWRVNLPFDWLESSLSYDAQTVNFTVGSIVTGGTSGAKGIILSDTDAGPTGTLTIKRLNAIAFTDNEALTDAAGGSATVNGTLSYNGPTITIAVRYKFTLNPTDVANGVSIAIAAPGQAVAGSSWNMSRSSVGHNDEWQTALFVYRPNALLSNISTTLTGVPASAIIMRIAAIDVYLGRQWNEPLNLSYT